MGANYGRGLFKQLQETIEQVEKLTAEIREIKSAHQMETASLKTEIESLRTENIALKTENQKLKAIINKDSSNSSKPPSSDAFKKIFNSREKTGRKPGGQTGHPGSVPVLFENPEKIINHKRERCGCGGTVTYGEEYQAKQIVELEIRAKVTEHRSYTGVCGRCNATIQNDMPLQDTITYGETVKAFVALLSSEGLVSISRIKAMLYEITNGAIALSVGTVRSVILRMIKSKTKVSNFFLGLNSYFLGFDFLFISWFNRLGFNSPPFRA